MADGDTLAHVAPPRFALAADALYGLTLLLTAVLPFELIRPVVTFPWFVFTDLEIVVIAAGLVWAAGVALSAPASLQHWRSTAAGNLDLLLPALLFLLLALLSAVLAPSHRLDALKFVTRFASGIFAFALVVNVTGTGKRLAGLLWALVLGAAASAFLGLLEAWNWRALGVLSLFKVAPTLVGGSLRVSATFQYATIAAMLFEMTVPVALGLAATAHNRGVKILATSSACLCVVCIVLTLTRSGVVTLAVILAVSLTMAWRWPRWRRLASPAAVSLLALLIALCALGVKSPAFRTRLVTENDTNWYGAQYSAPAALSVQAGQWLTTTIALRNTGRATWLSRTDHAYALGSRWLTFEDRQELRVPRAETGLPRDISPGESITLMASAQATLPPGTYLLSWGMLQRDILWFRHRDVPEAETVVQVLPGLQIPPAPLVSPDDLSANPPTLPRGELWQAAWMMVNERPLLGVGPDNFRHLHGKYLGLTNWDTSIYANNLYLELLADLGVPGLLLFGWLLLATVLRLYRALRFCSADPVAMWAVALGGSLLAFLIHGLLDYFLGITSIYLLFWMTLGLIVASARLLPDVRAERSR